MKKTILYLAFAIPFLLDAQNYKKEIIAVTRYFSNINNYSMNMRYQLYLDNNQTKPFQEKVIGIKRNSTAMKITYGSAMEILDNEKYQVIADHEDKTLTARKKATKDNEEDEIKDLNLFMDLHPDSLFYAYDKVKVLDETKDRVVYEMTFKPNDVMERTTMVINRKQKCYESITVKYKKPVKVNELDGKYHYVTLKLNYEEFKPNSVKKDGDFSEGNYVLVTKKGKVSPAKKYMGYRVIGAGKSE